MQYHDLIGLDVGDGNVSCRTAHRLEPELYHSICQYRPPLTVSDPLLFCLLFRTAPKRVTWKWKSDLSCHDSFDVRILTTLIRGPHKIAKLLFLEIECRNNQTPLPYKIFLEFRPNQLRKI